MLLIMLSSVLNAQEKATYRITYDCDALHSRTRLTYRWSLDIGRETAVFYNAHFRLHGKALEELKNGADLSTVMDGIRQLGPKYPNRNGLEVLIGAPEAGYYTYAKQIGADPLFYEEPLPQMDWQLMDSTSIICGYECCKAVATVYGRTWTVWYAPGIPLSYGPYVLGALPGLILDAVDEEGLFHFTAVGIETAPDDARIELYSVSKAVKCTRKKYLELRNAAAGRTWSEVAKAAVGSGRSVVKILDANGKEITDQKPESKNYLDKE